MSNVIVAERPDGIRIVRVTRPEEAIQYRASFAGAYQDIFSEPPYNERFFPSEAMGVLQQFLQVQHNITLLAVMGQSRVVGFGVGIPASAKGDISRELRGLLPVRHTFYFAELGVLAPFRGRSLGRELVRLRLDLIDKQRFTHAVVRISATRNSTFQMYLAMGFDDMGVYMEVPARRVDGSVTTDRRLFLSSMIRPAQTAHDTEDPAVE